MADGGRSASLLEDKIVEAAVVTVLTPIYELEFLGFSYGFRPKRNQHQALDALAFGTGKQRINWVLDRDVAIDVSSPSIGEMLLWRRLVVRDV
ncbi:MAG: hypothetical protein WA820_06565 [Bradyrhizobium sp.]